MNHIKATLVGGLLLFTAGTAAAQFSTLAVATTSSDIETSTDWPAWVHLPAQVELTLQAVGIASSREDAREQAQAELMFSISSQSYVQQVSVLSQAQGVAASSFIQQSSSRSLPLQLEGVEVVEHAQVNGQHAVMVSIGVSEVVTSLQDALAQIPRQPVPPQPVEQLLWALQHYSQSIHGLRIERALQNFDKGSSELRRDLLLLVEQAQTILNNSSIRVVAQSDTAPFVEVLTRQVPAGGEELLWLQLEQQQQTGRKETQYVERRSLQLTLRSSQSPFPIIRQHSLQAAAEAASPQAASSDVEYQLIQQLERPLYDWFL